MVPVVSPLICPLLGQQAGQPFRLAASILLTLKILILSVSPPRSHHRLHTEHINVTSLQPLYINTELDLVVRGCGVQVSGVQLII